MNEKYTELVLCTLFTVIWIFKSLFEKYIYFEWYPDAFYNTHYYKWRITAFAIWAHYWKSDYNSFVVVIIIYSDIVYFHTFSAIFRTLIPEYYSLTVSGFLTFYRKWIKLFTWETSSEDIKIQFFRLQT